MKTKIQNRLKRKAHIRKIVSGTSSSPRVSIFRSIRYIYAQAIDDTNSSTLAAASSEKMKGLTKLEQSEKVAKLLAEGLKGKGIDSIKFDRSGYKYHGRVKVIADKLREEGINF